MREQLVTARRFLRRLDDTRPTAPVPPELPPARIVNVDDRGEMFVRMSDGADTGHAVVLLHGWTLSADLNWFPGGYEMAARHGPVVAPDIRGHGRGLRSEEPFTIEAAADDVAALVRTLDIGPAILLGYSMGGSIALACAARHPDLVSGLVLASCALQWRASVWERVLWAGMGLAEYVLRFGAPEGITERYLRDAARQSPRIEPYLGWLKAEARRGDASDIGQAAKQLAKFDGAPLVERITVPAAVVVTVHDHLIRQGQQEALADALKCPTVHVPGHHNAWMVMPEAWTEALDDALAKVIANVR